MTKSEQSHSHSEDFVNSSGTEAMKEVGRNEKNLSNTAWGHTVRPHLWPNSGETQRGLPHLRKKEIKARVPQAHLGNPAYDKTLKPAPTAQRDPG